MLETLVESTKKCIKKIRGPTKFDNDNSGSVAGGAALTVGVGAALFGLWAGATVLGAYLGYGIGWGAGHIIDMLPYVKEAIPNLVRSVGLTPSSDVNVTVFEALGMIGGTGFGFYGPYAVAKKAKDRD
jgi:hypothetical protein